MFGISGKNINICEEICHNFRFEMIYCQAVEAHFRNTF